MKSLFSIIFYIQNGIIAASSATIMRQQKMGNLARYLMDENANLMRQIETKTERYANLEARIAVVEQENEIENEEKRNQLLTESKLNGSNRKEPVIAFRAISFKNSDQDNLSVKVDIDRKTGKLLIINDVST